MTDAKEIIKTVLIFLFCILIAYALATAITEQPNPLTWHFWQRAAVVAIACAGAVFLTKKQPEK